MNRPEPRSIRPVPAAALKAFTQGMFERTGMAANHAHTVAEVLIWANLRGMDSHGVMRVPAYVRFAQQGDLNVAPAMRLARETIATGLLEADRAAGPVAMMHAMHVACGKAQRAGIGLVIVRATTHTAALGCYTQMAARAGLAAIALAASRPNMAYYGARAAGVSTAPLSIAVPGVGEDALLLDMGTGMVSHGKLMQARRAGQSIPADWALDRAGNATTDAQAAAIPLPLGGPKGSGIALMAECLASLIASNPLLTEALESAAGARHQQNGLVIAIDIARFVAPASYRAEIARLICALKALPPQADVDEIFMPGERGDRTWQQRSRDGIPLPATLIEELGGLADRLGASPLAGPS